MKEGQIWKNTDSGVRVTITEIKRSKATGLRWIHFVDRRDDNDFLNEIHFLNQYELHIDTPAK